MTTFRGASAASRSHPSVLLVAILLVPFVWANSRPPHETLLKPVLMLFCVSQTARILLSLNALLRDPTVVWGVHK